MLSNVRYQVIFEVNICFEKLPNVYLPFKSTWRNALLTLPAVEHSWRFTFFYEMNVLSLLVNAVDRLAADGLLKGTTL